MKAVLRGFTTKWELWAGRWFDPRMQPAMSPFFVADCRREGVLVGPFVDPRGQIRDEVVAYPTWEAAAHELNLRPSDFAPAVPFVEGSIGPLGATGEEQRAFVGRLTTALGHLRAWPQDRPAYVRAVVSLTKDLVVAIGRLREKMHGSPPELPRAFQAKLDDRDRRVASHAQEHLAEMKAAEGWS